MTSASRRVMALVVMEGRTLLRDRRTLLFAVVLPLAVTPLMLWSSSWVEARRQRVLEARESSYAVVGPRADEVRALVVRARAASDRQDDRPEPPLLLRELTLGSALDAVARLSDGTLDFYLEGDDYARVTGVAVRPQAGQTAPVIDVDADGTPPPDLLTISLVVRLDRDTSLQAATRLAARLREVRRDRRLESLSAAGFPGDVSAVLPVDPANLAADSQVAGLAIGRLVTLFLLFFMLSGGAVVAQDTLAGEKERGTLETLLTTGIARREIVWAKVGLVLIVALAITVIQVANLLVYVGLGVVPAAQALTAVVTPGLAAGLLLFLLPLATLVAGVLVLISGFARSYREAQLYFLPVMLAGAVPALAAWLPEITLRSAIVLVPVANISVGAKELLIGRTDWPMLLVAWVVTAAAAGAAIQSATRVLSTEHLIVPGARDEPARRTPADLRLGHVTSWFAAMWATMLLVSVNAGPSFDIRAQLFVNLVLFFLGGSWLFIRRFGLDPRAVLSLRLPHPAVWVAVAAGIPAGLITGIGVFRLSQLVVPVSPEVLESFSQYAVPEGVPLWQLVPMMTLLPGICEEVAFRGVLLYGLRRHFSIPVTLLLVGGTFGLFHFSFFRIFQTAYLGVLLAGTTILSGSILPAMAWHAGSNGLALVSERLGFSMSDYEPRTYVAATLVLTACFWVLWRTRAEVATLRLPAVVGASRRGPTD